MTVKERYEHIQSIFQNCGKEGCHFLALCSIADEYRRDTESPYADILTTINVAFKNNWLRSDFYVLDAISILNYITGKKWTSRTVKELPSVIKDNEYTEAVYYNPRTGHTHFRRRYFDTLTSSTTVKEGYVKEYRIYTVEE